MGGGGSDDGSDCPLTSVCFAVDESGSIGQPQFAEELRFVNSIASTIADRAENVEYSAVFFSTRARVRETGTQSLSDFQNTVSSTVQAARGTDITAGLNLCLEQISENPGIKIIVVLTDGISRPNPVSTANSINAMEDISIVSVGIGPNVNANTLRDVAARPEFFLSTRFDELPTAVLGVVSNVCSAAVPPIDGCQNAFNGCDFRFQGVKGLPTFELPKKPDFAFTPRIISTVAGENLGVLNTNNIIPEFIMENGAVTNITMSGNPNFTPTHFKPFNIPNTSGSGIGHQTFHGNQFMQAKPRCVRVFFTEFQTLIANTDFVAMNFNGVSRVMNKCVVFKTK